MNRRWRILGTMTTRTPLHIGSGAVTDHSKLKADDDGKPCDVQAIVRDSRRGPDGSVLGRPCIPGTALKGVLRSWGERFFTSDASTAMLRRIFGQRDIRANDSESGWAEFTAAMVERPPTNLEPYAAHVPYWRAERLTGILSHVAIDAATGAAARNKLYFEEFVPEGVSFDVEILATRLDPAEIELLLALLEQGAHHPTHPYQFGANGADGWGRMDWSLVGVFECSAPPTAIANVGFAACAKPYTLSGNAKLHAPAAPPPHVALELTLDFDGPLLVDDKSRTKEKDVNDGRTNSTRLRRANGDTWLPASSFRGVLRGRAEFILRSLQMAKVSPAAGEKPAIDDVLPPIERVFGATSLRSRLTIEEFVEATDSDRWRTDRRQDFVAIDRFLGGAAEGAKFDARYADRPRLTSRLVLDLEGLAPEDVALAAAALRDVCSGVATFGFGGSKGYGRATGTVRLLGLSGVDPDWLAPESLLEGQVDESGSKWLSDRLSRFLPAAVAVPALADFDVPAPVIPVPGKLMLQTTKKGDKRVVTWLKKNGKWTETPTPIDDESQVSRTLMNRRDREIEVDLELDAKNKPVHIRPRDEPWVAEVAAQSFAGRFAHPYYFARLVSRIGPAFQGDLGDRAATGLDRYRRGFFSGRLRIRLRTKTPLLICDDETVRDADGHKTYDVRLQDGKPLLASSSVRGMLRAVYEAATNSRFGVFPGTLARDGEPAEKHGRRLGLRQPARDGLKRVPVRVIEIDGRLHVQPLPGTSDIAGSPNASGNTPPVFAAWCAWYDPHWRPKCDVPLQHGAKVWAFLTPWTYRRESRERNGKPTVFNFWNVEEIRATAPAPAEAVPTDRRRRRFGNASPADWDKPRWAEGYLCITGRNIDRKHDERFFFSVDENAPIPLSTENQRQWRELIEDYQDQHRDDVKAGETCPSIFRKAHREADAQSRSSVGGGRGGQPFVYSRHISHQAETVAVEVRELRPGDLMHADLKRGGDGWQVVGLYPVMISRKLFEKSPLDLLPLDLRPATDSKSLSPADRVFGWVNQDGDSTADDEAAQRSAVRVGPVECRTADAIECFGSSQPLAILGQPKPHQGRFYLGDKDGRAHKRGGSKEDVGYKDENRVRGPKVYPHHRTLREDTWIGWEETNQNRSITGWVRPETTFEFDLELLNLSRLELSALLWVLSMPDDHFLKLGLGKPLGFGSVRAEIVSDRSCIADGAAWINSLVDWNGDPIGLSIEQRKGLIDEFAHKMSKANPDLLPSLLKAASGFANLLIHYPTTDYQEDPNEHFQWFAANEKSNLPQSLPNLADADISLK